MAVTCRICQWLPSFFRCSSVNISPSGDELPGNIYESGLACLVQKDTAVICLCRNVCTFAQQVFGHFFLPGGQCPISRGPAEFIPRIYFCAAIDDLSDLVQVTFEHGILESGDIYTGPDELSGHVRVCPLKRVVERRPSVTHSLSVDVGSGVYESVDNRVKLPDGVEEGRVIVFIGPLVDVSAA